MALIGRDPIEVSIEGFPELLDKIKRIGESMSGPEAGRIYFVVARRIRQVAVQEAPVGNFEAHTNHRGVRWVPGMLRRAIVAFQGRQVSKVDPRSAYVRVNIFKGADRAPHAHLVELGTRSRTVKSAPFLRFKTPGGGWVRKKSVAGMRANPFFRRAVQSSGSAALNDAMLEQQRLIDKAAR